ncbi:EamA family transporter RarD [Biformimicrobium ophioploci]|uniref:EamA family transporter RarD n=1 Tax=Biformimicrobium ophioploci TaxID=3036711 RepID=A0ABQ6M0B8_9GAMM|nr:EamA family transporter RarD [Microbulbifer sp. NKW57]GMG87804.1 EamA family transporter RarD [Microbulbifer sp. NKW57]
MQQESSPQGLAAGVAAYTIWGLAPLYFYLLKGISAPEILAHRVIWSALLAIILVLALKKAPTMIATLRKHSTMGWLAVSTVLITVNWLIFIWAVTSNKILDASLGYYINPLFNVVLGVLVLGERMRPLQWLAVIIAACGVAYEIIGFGRVPLVALALAGTFGLYGLIRKQAPVDSLTGLAIETLMLVPLALGFLFFSTSPTSNLAENSASTNALLMAAGPITLVPLLLFTVAARRLKLSTLGQLQYIGPTLMFMLALFYFDSDFEPRKLVTFGLVWTGIALFTAESIWRQRRLRKPAS